MLEAKIINLTKKYHQKSILNISNLTICEGETIGIIGKNGSGKTTLAEIILGVKKQTTGSIEYSIKKIRRNAVFQESNFDDDINLRQTYNFYQKLFNSHDPNNFKSDYHEDFKKYGLDGLEKHKFSTLSGGQKQRFKMLVSMMNDPQLVLFDEVTNSLDLTTKKWFNQQLLEKDQQKNAIILLISHDPNEILSLCNRMIKIEDGKIVYDDNNKGQWSLEAIETLMEGGD